MTVESVGTSGSVALHRFAVRGPAARGARQLAFTFDPDLGDGGNDILRWIPEGSIAIAGDSVDGYWGARLVVPSLREQTVIQMGQGLAADPRSVEELRDLARRSASLTIAEPRDVRFVVFGTLAPQTRGGVVGIVASATGADATAVLASLQALDTAQVLALADPVQPVGLAPSKYGMGQVLSEYTGPLMRVDGTDLSSVSSSTSALDRVKSSGLTALRLEIPERSALTNVRVVLYSLTGLPVRQLVSEPLEAGRYVVGWDGKDDNGRRVQPGVYVAVMIAGSFRETRRLVVR